MANHTESSGQSAPDRHKLSDEERDQRITSHSSGSGSDVNSPHEEESGSGEMGPMHTNAGSTGFGSGQISPKTQNLPQTGPSASHPAVHKDSSGEKR